MIRKNLFCICFSLCLAPLALDATGKYTLCKASEEGGYANQPAVPTRVGNSIFYVPLQGGNALDEARKIANGADETEKEPYLPEEDDNLLVFVQALPPLERVVLVYNAQGGFFRCHKLSQHAEDTLPFIAWCVAELFDRPAKFKACVKEHTEDDDGPLSMQDLRKTWVF